MAKPAPWDYPFLKKEQPLRDTRDSLVKHSIPRDLFGVAGSDYLELGGHRIPIAEAQGTSLIMGISRSGKSLEQKTMMGSALRAIRPGSDRRAVILDAKGDMLPVVWKACQEQGVPLWYFNLADRRTIAPHIARDLEGRPDKIYEFFKILIPEPAQGERFWAQVAQVLGSVIALTLYQEKGDRWGLHDLYRIVLSDIPALISFLQLHPQGRAVAARYLPQDTGQNTQYGFLTQLTVSIQQLELAAVNQYYTPESNWFSLAEFLQTEGVFLIGANSDVRKATNPIVQALFRLYVNFISRLPDSRSRKLFTFIDEVPFWGKIDGLDELLTFCPSKGAVNALVVQGIEQLYALYGEHTARAIAGQSVFKLFFHPTDGTSARWMVDQMGQYRVYEVRRSSSFGRGGESHSKSEDYVLREPVTTGELFDLPLAAPRSGNNFYLVSPWTGVVRKERLWSDVLKGLPPDAKIPVLDPKPKHELSMPLGGEQETYFRQGFSRDAVFEEFMKGYAGAHDFEREIAAQVFRMMEELLDSAFDAYTGFRERGDV